MGYIDRFGKLFVNRNLCGRYRRPLPCACVGNPPNLMRRNSDSFVLPPVNWEDRRPLWERALEFREAMKRGRKNKCSLCQEVGHNRQTCSKKNQIQRRT